MKQLLSKKNLFVLLFLTAVCTIFPAKIAKADTSGYFTYSYSSSSKTATITKYTGDEINCVIPKSLGGYKVTKIGNHAFNKKNIMQTVSIPSTVKTIEYQAFSECKNLKSVTIPDSVTDLGRYSFAKCPKLASVKIGKGIKKLNSSTFSNCTSLSNVSLSNGLVELDSGVFQNCDALTSITFPSSLKIIGDYAFSECDGLKEFVIPDTVTTIKTRAFSECTNLEKITVGANITEIPTRFVQKCTNLKTVIFKSKKIKTFKEYSFYGCTSLESITIPSSVDTLEADTFKDCTSLSNIKLNEGLKTLGNYVFIDCRALKEITIPSSVVIFGSLVFDNCRNLEKIILKSSIFSKDGTKIEDSNFFYAMDNKAVIQCYKNNEFINGLSGFDTQNKNNKIVYMDTIPATKLTLDKSKVTIAKGSYTKVTRTLTPANSTDSTIFFSSNTKIATVDQRGNIYGVGYGTATITVRTPGGLDKDNCLKQVTVNVCPEKVKGFALASRGTTSIKAKWTKINGVDGYRVFKKTSTGYKYIKDLSSYTTDYTFNNLSSGSKYSFAIKAYKVLSGSSRVYSAEYPVLSTFTSPAKVSGFAKKTVGTTSVSTTWKATKGASGYRMYIYKSGKWNKVATVKGTSYTFKNLKRHNKYKFAVIAYKTVGKTTAAASSYPTITVTTK